MNKEFMAELAAHGDVWCADLSRVEKYMLDRKEASAPRVPRVTGNIAVIPLRGVLTKRGTWYSDGTDSVLRAIESAIASKAIGGIVLDIDSPGGSTYGLAEFAEAIFQFRGSKPIIAVANPLAASAAYWAGCSADQVVASPSADVGSVGVWTMHVDQSKMLDDLGYKVTLVNAGKYKVEGNSYEPLSEEAKAELQRSVDESYDQFIGALSRYRGKPRSTIVSDFGEGRVLSSERALAAGMIDRIATLDQVLEKMGAVRVQSRSSASVDAELELLAAWEGSDVVASDCDVESRRLKRVRERSRI